MSTSRTASLAIAARYATAIFDLAVDAKKEAAVVAEFAQLADAVRGNPALADALANPLLSRAAKSELLGKLATDAEKLTGQSLDTLASQGRAEILPELADALAAKLAKHQDAVVAEVTSARPLAKPVQQQIHTALKTATGKDVQLSLREDPAVLGGVSIRVGSYLLDATLAGALSNIKRQLLAPQYS